MASNNAPAQVASSFLIPKESFFNKHELSTINIQMHGKVIETFQSKMTVNYF